MARLKNISRNLAAFLDMIAFSEGTQRVVGSDDGYDVLVGGTLFKGYDKHPHVMVDLPKLGIKSSAAGRYQLLGKYADAYMAQLNLRDFSPENQDRIAIQQIKERNALADIEAGRFALAVSKCKNIWASLPGAGYGQHEHTIQNLQVAYTSAGGVLA